MGNADKVSRTLIYRSAPLPKPWPDREDLPSDLVEDEAEGRGAAEDESDGDESGAGE